MEKVAAEFLAEASRPRDFFEANPFRLPGHIRHWQAAGELPKECQHVVGDIYRLPEIKFSTVSAEALNTDESVERTLKACRSPKVDKGVVQAAADAENALANLARLARNGDGKALWQFAHLVCMAVEGLGEIVRSNPDAIKPLAKQCTRWPMMRSRHPLNCDDDGLLEKIELSKSARVQLDKYSKWKPDYAANVAGALMEHIEAIRRQNPFFMDGKQKVWFANFLPPCSKETAPHWWLFAEKFLLAAYPKPEQIAELDALVTATSKRKYPSTRRVAILEKIHARFNALALI